MTCEQATELIGPYNDDELPLETRRRVEAHLLTCKMCAWESASLQVTRERLREGIGETVASDAFRARVLNHLRADNPHLHAQEQPVEEPLQYHLPISI